MNKKRSTSVLSYLILIVLCVCVSGGVGYLYNIPFRAAQIYGPASPALSDLDTLRLSFSLLQSQGTLLTPTNPSGESIPFVIESGDSPIVIAARLQSDSLIADQSSFINYLIYAGLDTQIQSGRFELSPAFPPVVIAHTLLDPNATSIEFAVLPGWRIEEIAVNLATSGLSISAEEFLEAARYPEALGWLAGELPGRSSAEGFLMPGSYDLYRGTDADGLVQLLLGSFESQVTEEIRQGFAEEGLSLYEGVILASIVQREAVVPEERSTIAGVFINRLAIGMRLETDPTVQYAIGYNQAQATWWTNPLSFNDLQFESPYNTYLVAGLPPGPIANPSLNTLAASAFPAKNPYFFFRAACDGSGTHVFSVTFEEHQANACP